MIFDLGVEIAKIEAERAGVELVVLLEEQKSMGIPTLKEAYRQKKGRYRNPKDTWLSDEPIESW